MNVLIIEDELPASRKLIRLLMTIDKEIVILDVLKSIEQATNWFLQNTTPDLVFMDIQLEDGICFEIFENCKITAPVIFTTAYDEYTLKAFKVNSVDYLLKPIDPTDLTKAVGKFRELHYRVIETENIKSVLDHFRPKIKERFLIKIGEHYKSIPTTNIQCFYIEQRCNFILVDTGKSYPVDYSLDNIVLLIDPKMFYRINRNCIVRLTAIQDIIAYSPNRLKLIITNWQGNEDILVSRDRVAGFKEWMDR